MKGGRGRRAAPVPERCSYLPLNSYTKVARYWSLCLCPHLPDTDFRNTSFSNHSTQLHLLREYCTGSLFYLLRYCYLSPLSTLRLPRIISFYSSTDIALSSHSPPPPPFGSCAITSTVTAASISLGSRHSPSSLQNLRATGINRPLAPACPPNSPVLDHSIAAMLRVIPYPPPPRSTINGDNRMSGHHLHQQPRMVPNVPEPTPEPVVSPATVSRVYRAATSLFLTRRLPDALMALQPIIADSVSPRVRCSRTLRTKVWSLYFAILDATAKMGPEEGKKVWGAQEWRRIVSRVRSGAIWNEAIQIYGEEGRVDGDVVNTLYAAPRNYIVNVHLHGTQY